MVEQELEIQEEPKRPSHFVSVLPKECHSCPGPLLTHPCRTSSHSVMPCKHQATSVLSRALISHNTVSISADIQRLAPMLGHPPG